MEQTGKADGVQSILNDLYAIRAGMSFISQEKDKVDTKYNQNSITLDKKLAEINTVSSLVNIRLVKTFERKKFNTPQNYLATQCSAYSANDLNLVQFEKSNYSSEYNRKKIPYKICKFLSILSPIMIIVGFLSFLLHYLSIWLTWFPYTLAGFIASIICYILGLIICIIVYKIIKRYDINRCLRQIKNCDSVIFMINEYNKTTPKILKETSEFHKRISVQCNQFYQAMLAQSHSFDPRDWKYADILIFYFETGRSNNIKEALLHLDREIQTQQITYSIESSAKYICNTIEHYSLEIIKRLDMMIRQMNKLNDTALQQLNQQSMQTALLAKMAESSEKLASDTNYMVYGR